MNPDETARLMTLIKEIRDPLQPTVLVIEHHMDLIMGVCERIVVLNFGKLAEGTAGEVRPIQGNRGVPRRGGGGSLRGRNLNVFYKAYMP